VPPAYFGSVVEAAREELFELFDDVALRAAPAAPEAVSEPADVWRRRIGTLPRAPSAQLHRTPHTDPRRSRRVASRRAHAGAATHGGLRRGVGRSTLKPSAKTNAIRSIPPP
jgi:hypothetical protein